MLSRGTADTKGTNEDLYVNEICGSLFMLRNFQFSGQDDIMKEVSERSCFIKNVNIKKWNLL